MRPLHGIRVLDLSRLIPGPFATLVLADLGAQVDKIEDAGAGDYLRFFPPLCGDVSAGFHLLNRDKRSAVIDLKKPEGKAAFLGLLAGYDVLVEQFRPGVMDRLGLSHASLRERFPRLVICAVTGYGQDGPYASQAGHDLNFLARAGLLGAMGPADGPPQVPGFQLADVSGAMWAVIAILAALRQRDATGQGSVCDVAMSEGALGFAALSLAGGMAGVTEPRGEGLLTGGIAPYRTYLTEDGQAVALAALEPKFWATFCAGVGLACDGEALVPGPHQAALIERLAATFASRTRDEWRAFGAAHDCCLTVVVRPEELRADPHLQARGVLFELEDRGVTIPEVRMPVTPRDATHTVAPTPGRDTRAIFRDAGLNDDAIDALLAARAIA
ncbi:MAG: CoA transferase [Deltaproteobacteria bacterium]|nr:CoA transferase [Deltaproteobacteria bacterium]